ncbi:beta-glucosidase family protein [Sanyastnella coralliicola]|uniref:beta-glucosidase family protein n=1 Tax=Sanyastnella coralliicola TaxID=3069118 RepID=UPI0027B8F291|nr:glycoside hydrolase family 3 N-terminal domain-containing protein [Longitalea sp. SCSIO 12813]
MEELLSKMTLEEKVGQMTQLTLDMILEGEPYASVEPHHIDEPSLQEVIVDLNVGSILNCGGHSYPREFWLDLMTRIQDKAKETPNQIPVLYGIDAIHGVTYTDNSTLIPQQIGLACTWDTSMVKSLSETAAYEVRASGIPWNFSPVLDIARDPRWPRFWETFGEDVKLVTDMGSAMVDGYQGSGDEIDSVHVAACLKHFLGYSVTLSGKDRTQAWVPERQLREYFLPGFEEAIERGAKTIMVNSGEMNGIPVHVNPAILTDLLRNELGFEGMVVTDWEDIKYLVSRHKVAATYKEAIKMAVDAGIDMSMVPTDLEFPVLLKELVEEGEISEARIDESVRRILQLKFDLGLFDAKVPSLDDYPDFASAEARASALEAARASIVMLKNENVLPLNGGERLLVVGDNANSLNVLNGGWTRTWQGVDPQYNTPDMPSFLEEVQSRFASVTYMTNDQFLASRGVSADHVIAFLGETPYTETPGDIEDLDLPENQIEVIGKLGELSVPTSLILSEGRPRTFGELPEGIDAFILAMLPGDQGGRALVDVLLGEHNPGGHLPFTYPRYPSAHTTYDHKYTDMMHIDFSTNAVNPLYEFGDGLSYTTFEMSDLSLSADTLGAKGTLDVSVVIKNTGDLAGSDVIQVYVSDSVATITPSVKRLRAYRKVELDAGASQEVQFSIPVQDFAFVGIDNDWVVEPGVFGVVIGDMKETLIVK